MRRNRISRAKRLALRLGSAAILTCQPLAAIAQGFEEGSFNEPGSGAPQDDVGGDGAGGGFGEGSFAPGAGGGAQPGGAGFEEGSFEEGSFEDGGVDPEASPKVAQDPGPDDQVGPEPEPGGGSFEEGSFEDGNVGPGPGPDDPEPGPDPDDPVEPDPKVVGGDDFDSGNFDDPDPRLVPPRPEPDSPPPPEPTNQVTLDPQIFAFETRDFGVPPQSQLRSGQFHAPTPTALPGGKLVSTEGLLQAFTAGTQMVVIDVLGNNYGLPNALTATALATPGNFQDRTQQQAAAWLSQITQGDNTVAIIVYCSDPMCWLSYNAALRVIAAGYTNVYWYRGGLQAWQMAGLQVQPTGF